MNFIEIKSLDYSFDRKKLFDNLNLNIKQGDFVAITGKNSCGKTTLIKLLSGIIITENKIYIDGTYINKLNKELIDEKVSIFSPDNKYFSKTVLDELMLEMKKDDIYSINRIKKYLKEFNLIDYINCSPQCLDYFSRQKLSLIKALLNESKLLLIDNIFCYFDKYSKIEFIGLLKKYQLENNITIVCTINNLDDSIFCDRLIILNDGNILLDGYPDDIFRHEKMLKLVGLNIPLNYELLGKLKLYGLINSSSLAIDDMVMELCK